ncbi:MAG TPA: hypothetical protein VFV64_13775, partial [Permianibacter sp.]|nr:hypothetical protein [Permianibacter sp.]
AERARAKFQRRSERFGSAISAVLIVLESILTLVFIRAIYRLLMLPFRRRHANGMVIQRS